MEVRIVLVDDHGMVRQGLRSLVEKEPGLKIIGEAADGRTAVRICLELKPDLVVMDLTMPELNGMAAAQQILAVHPGIKILILSMHADRRFVAQTLGAGASGYLVKDNAFEELVKAIQAIMGGQKFLSPQIAALVAEDYKQGLLKEQQSKTPVLSDREREVLQLLAEGPSTKEIAAELSLSGKTIETHRQQIMSKLKLDSVAALTKYAIREGLTSI